MSAEYIFVVYIGIFLYIVHIDIFLYLVHLVSIVYVRGGMKPLQKLGQRGGGGRRVVKGERGQDGDWRLSV